MLHDHSHDDDDLGHDDLGHDEPTISRRAAMQLGAGAGIAAVAAPYVARMDRAGALLGGARPALTPNFDWPAPPIITRAQWGANEALRKGGQIYDSKVTKLIVHHTATPNSATNYAGLCRGIMNSEVAGEYIDIAYNWLIDPHGRIYEGRWAQDYAPGAVHTGQKGGWQVRGGHAIYHNANTIGIALMGNYDLIPPSAAMINGLATVLAWKCARWGINPTGSSVYVPSSGAPHNLANITGHRNTSATACPGSHIASMMPQIRAKVAGRLSGSGYWIGSSSGQVMSFGGAPSIGNAVAQARSASMTGIAGHPSGRAYWLHNGYGKVWAYGTTHYGDVSNRRLSAPIIDMASTPSGRGYWLLGLDGGVFTFGDAKFYGSTGNKRLNAPVLAIVPTPSGRGYWLCARDGGIFTFGDAKFFGSTGGMRLARPVIGMAARPQGDGYWLLGEDGGVFCFGNARFRGSWPVPSGSPCVSMIATTTGKGYAMVRQNGAVRTFGDAPNLGNALGRVRGVAVGIAGRLKPF